MDMCRAWIGCAAWTVPGRMHSFGLRNAKTFALRNRSVIPIAPMKRSSSGLGAVILLSLVWIALNEAITVFTVVSAPLIAAAAIYFTNRFVLERDYLRTYRVGSWTLIKYVIYLIGQVYTAGFAAMARIFTGKINLDIVHITSELDNDFHISLLANSITLTPGTVTVDKKGDKLDVLWIDAHTHDAGEAGEEIKGGFERLLKADELKHGLAAG